MTEVSLGVTLPFRDGMITSGSFLVDFVGAIEAAGVDSVWSVEHVVVADAYEPRYPYSPSGRIPGAAAMTPMPDPLELLAFVAAVSQRLLLGTAVVVAPLHSPVVLAKRAATIDRLSGGRLLLGLGIGWQREEYDAVGMPFEGRGKRLDEGIDAMRALWRDSPASYAGETVAFDRVHMLPRPERGTIPIVLGGHSDGAIARAGRVADGWYPWTIGPDELAAAMARLADAARAAGRSPDDVAVTVSPGSADPARQYDPEWVGRYVEVGPSRLMIPVPLRGPDDLDTIGAHVDRYRNEVLAKLRS